MTDTVVQCIVGAVTIVTTVPTSVLVSLAVLKVEIRELTRRQTKTEDCLDRLPHEYVPRRELSHTLRNLEQSMLDIKEYVRMVARRKRKATERIVKP